MAFGKKSDQIADLERANEQLRSENAQLTSRLVEERQISAVADMVRAELNDPANQLELNETAATIAKVAVIGAEKARITEETSATLRQERYDEFAAEFRASEGADIRARLDAVFETDGTYVEVEERAKADVTHEIQESLRAERYRVTREQLSSDENREAIWGTLVDRAMTSEELEAHRQQVRQDLEGEWRPAAEDEARRQIEAEEVAREADYKARTTASFKDSYDMQYFRRDTRARLEKKWNAATLEKVREAVHDEEERAVIDARIAHEVEQLKEDQKQAEAAKLLEEFESLGIDTEAIRVGAKVSIYLGELKKFEVERTVKDSYGYSSTKKVKVPGMVCRRKLNLLAVGDGKFVVELDSVATSESVYEREIAIPDGTVIVIGGRLRENGKEEFHKKLTADRNFFFDDDTTTPAIVDTKLPLGNVEIDGVSARKLEKIEYKN